ncbi:MAG: DUF3710 domain-containing protein [Bifidobacteriaceae bacterium]|jgi:hypothetical protein|nr:DUF3710 domain-containing protein [Bifidobacteriaceae bacterium]
MALFKRRQDRPSASPKDASGRAEAETGASQDQTEDGERSGARPGGEAQATADPQDALGGSGEGDQPGDQQEDRQTDQEGDQTASGPFDEAEQPGLEGLADFGAVRLPVRAGFKVSAGVAKATGRPVSLTVSKDGSQLELQAFAAPKTAGIWEEALDQLEGSAAKQGGKATRTEGRFGPELIAEIPVATAQGRTGKQVVRFIGVDGPRWLLRGAITGKAARERAAAADLEDLFAGVVVVRGGEARPPREPLPLRLPGAARLEPGGGDAQGESPGLLKRGPEITEVR